jgi:hypothetical protein
MGQEPVVIDYCPGESTLAHQGVSKMRPNCASADKYTIAGIGRVPSRELGRKITLELKVHFRTLNFNRGKRVPTDGRRADGSNIANLAPFAAAFLLERNAQRDRDSTCGKGSNERAHVNAGALLSTRGDNGHFDDHSQPAVKAPRSRFAGGYCTGKASAQMAQKVEAAFVQYCGKFGEACRSVSKTLHPLRRHAVTKNGDGVHTRRNLAYLRGAPDADCIGDPRIIFANQIGHITSIEDGPCYNKPERAAHKNGIERLANIL